MKTYLVTGGCGFIGSNYILDIIIDPNNFVINVDKLTYASNKLYLKTIENNKNYKFIKCDILNKRKIKKIIKKYKIDYCIHFAAESHVEKSFKNPNPFIKTNIIGTRNLLDSFKNNKNYTLRKFIHISTDEVYGSNKQENFYNKYIDLVLNNKKVIKTFNKLNKINEFKIENLKNYIFKNFIKSEDIFTETSPYNPTSPYSITKVCAEIICLYYAKTYNIPLIITRPCNNYGINQHPEKLIPKVFLACYKNEDIIVQGNGLQTRDFINVKDNINAINLLIEKGENLNIYNVCASNEQSVLNIINKIINYAKQNINKDLKSKIIQGKNRPIQDMQYKLDNSKIKSLGFKIETNFETEFINTLNYYNSNINLLLNAKF